MSKYFFPTLHFIVLFLWLSTEVFAGSTVFLTNGEWIPFQSKTLKHYGVVSHIVTEAFKIRGCQIKYKFYPWKRAYHLGLKGDKFNGTLVWGLNEERKKLFYISKKPVVVTNEVFFYLKTLNFDWRKWESDAPMTERLQSFGPLRIGGSLGYQYGDEFMVLEKIYLTDKANHAKIPRGLLVDYADSDEVNLKKLFFEKDRYFPMLKGSMPSIVKYQV